MSDATDYFERHAQPAIPYWEIGGVPNTFLAETCDGHGQVYLLGDGRIVNARGLPYSGLVRPLLRAVLHAPETKDAGQTTDRNAPVTPPRDASADPVQPL